MSMITLTEGFSVIPEGVHVFKITDVSYKEEFGKMEVMMKTAKGRKHTERFCLMNKEGELNEGALNAFSFFAKTVLNDFSLTEIDHEDLIGHYIRATVEHEKVESKKKPDTYMTFARLCEMTPADGFDEEPTPPKTETKTETKKSFDLNSILG